MAKKTALKHGSRTAPSSSSHGPRPMDIRGSLCPGGMGSLVFRSHGTMLGMLSANRKYPAGKPKGADQSGGDKPGQVEGHACNDIIQRCGISNNGSWKGDRHEPMRLRGVNTPPSSELRRRHRMVGPHGEDWSQRGSVSEAMMARALPVLRDIEKVGSIPRLPLGRAE